MRFPSKLLCSSLLLGLVTAFSVHAQEFPNKPIRFVAPDAGGNGDLLARIIAQGLGVKPGWQVFVDNRSSRTIPGEIVAKSPPDGYTLLVNGASHWLAQFLQADVPYDAIKDFAPVTQIHSAPNIVVVNPSVPAKSVQELIALAKARPGQLNYGAVGIGSGTHLAAELFNAMANVKITRIAYKGMGVALNDLMAGRVQVIFSPASGWPLVKSGKLRALGVASLRPSALFPDLPTVASSGLPGYESVSITGAFAPAKTPVAIIRTLNQAIVATLRTPEMKEKFAGFGSEIVASSPEEFAVVLKNDIATMGKLIKDLDLKDE